MYENVVADLIKLQQKGTVLEYLVEFEALLIKTDQIPTDQVVSYFVSGLKDSIKSDVETGKPPQHCMQLCV